MKGAMRPGTGGPARGRPGGRILDGRPRLDWPRLAALGGALALVTYVGLVDPDRGGAYPLCPSRRLLGLDCPGCGGLRGTHALLHGRVVEALDHNLLLPVILAVAAAAFALWLLPLAGRPARTLRLPRWAVIGACVVGGAFALLRNLPVSGLEFLASA